MVIDCGDAISETHREQLVHRGCMQKVICIVVDKGITELVVPHTLCRHLLVDITTILVVGPEGHFVSPTAYG